MASAIRAEPSSSHLSLTSTTTSSPYSSHGNSADDERSTPSLLSAMGPSIEEPSGDGGDTELLPTSSYEGEDTRPTSQKELLAFYTYSFAAEVFVVCGLGAFIPITLEELTRASATAVLASDHSKPCQSRHLDLTPPGNPTLLSTGDATTPPRGHQCVFQLLGAELNTASFAMYTFSISVLLQALVVVTMSGAADHGRYRKSLMLIFAGIGSLATMLFLVVTPSVYLLGSLWAIVGNVSFGASWVLLNSFLPLLVRHHPEVRPTEPSISETIGSIVLPIEESHPEASRQMSNTSEVATLVDSTASLLPRPARHQRLLCASNSLPSPRMQLSTKISSYGVGVGYVAAVIVQVLSIIILQTTGGSTFSLRLVLAFIGLWWLTFTIPAALLLRPRPGPPIPLAKNQTYRTWAQYLTYSWQNLYRTILRARRLKDILLFLAAWFLVSDAIATVSGTAILFAKTTLGMPSSALAMINVITILSGIGGAFAWSKISYSLQLKPSQTILACICIFEIIPFYGLLGYIPAVKRHGSFGLQQQWEMYPIGAVYGLVLGGLSSYCRSLFAELVPPGSEAAFFALYAITDKGSSVFGPAVVGAITDATGDIRPAFWFLAVLIGLPIPLMSLVDIERGRRDAEALAKEVGEMSGLKVERRESLRPLLEDM
ncbi:hypothetical protein MBLNU230_g1272t1 [Neophaeotheca triangularis]